MNTPGRSDVAELPPARPPCALRTARLNMRNYSRRNSNARLIAPPAKPGTQKRHLRTLGAER